MIILGVDPGVARTGWAVLEVFAAGNQKKVRALDYGCVETSVNKPYHKRFAEIAEILLDVIKKYKTDILAIEELFFIKKARTVLATAQSRGVVLYLAAKNNMKVFEYNPRVVKTSLTGYGSADKNQMQIMAKNILGLREIPKPDDTADAIAVALCHYFNSGRFA